MRSRRDFAGAIDGEYEHIALLTRLRWGTVIREVLAIGREEDRRSAPAVSNLRAATVIAPMHARGAPDLVVEIASKGTRKRDETIKRRLYERDGVAEYWVVDPDIDVVRVYRREGDVFNRPSVLTREAADVLTTPLLPGFELPLERIFRELQDRPWAG